MNINQLSRDFIQVFKDASIYKFLIPGIIATIFFSGILALLGGDETAEVANPEVVSWWQTSVNAVISGVRWFSQMLFEFTVITLFSPFMAMLSERTAYILTGKSVPFSIGRFIKEISRTIGILISGFILSSLLIGILNLFSFLLDLSQLHPALVFIIKAFFIGFNYFDYALERDLVPIKASWKYASQNPFYMLLAGLIFSALFIIPYLGICLAPFVATIFTSVVYERKKN